MAFRGAGQEMSCTPAVMPRCPPGPEACNLVPSMVPDMVMPIQQVIGYSTVPVPTMMQPAYPQVMPPPPTATWIMNTPVPAPPMTWRTQVTPAIVPPMPTYVERIYEQYPSPAQAVTRSSWTIKAVTEEGKGHLEIAGQGDASWTCPRMSLKLPGDQQMRVNVTGEQVEVHGPCFHGSADSVTIGGPTHTQIALTGHVHFWVHGQDDHRASVTGERILLNLADGTVQMKVIGVATMSSASN
jgi:hypothetical protein